MTGSEMQGGAVSEGGMSGAEEIPVLPFPSCFEHPAGQWSRWNSHLGLATASRLDGLTCFSGEWPTASSHLLHPVYLETDTEVDLIVSLFLPIP